MDFSHSEFKISSPVAETIQKVKRAGSIDQNSGLVQWYKVQYQKKGESSGLEIMKHQKAICSLAMYRAPEVNAIRWTPRSGNINFRVEILSTGQSPRTFIYY